jgi:hypothetical protein
VEPGFQQEQRRSKERDCRDLLLLVSDAAPA